MANGQLIDGFNREITYLRLSVTDRCDYRCIYCMDKKMQFVPKQRLLSFREMSFIAQAFTELGVKKIRITGGEPLIRHNVQSLFRSLGELPGLDELTLTTNGSQLAKMADSLFESGVRRVNISLDSLKPERFKQITRKGDLNKVLQGIDAARTAGFQKIKINALILKNRNDDEILDLVSFAINNDLDISFIEEMPLGNLSEHNRQQSASSNNSTQQIIAQQHPLYPSTESSGGPSRYFRTPGTHSRIGFISAHSHNFCDQCNRVRLTAEGQLLLCLGNESSVDLRGVIRQHPGNMDKLKQVIVDAVVLKPKQHEFNLNDEPQILRFMNATGG